MPDVLGTMGAKGMVSGSRGERAGDADALVETTNSCCGRAPLAARAGGGDDPELVLWRNMCAWSALASQAALPQRNW
ncbi:MAG: hypothetical protein ACK53A_14265 [Gemmatimonadota bacterium]